MTTFALSIDRALAPWLERQAVALPAYTLEEPPAEIPADAACNIALLLAKPLKKSPRAIAQELQTLLGADADGPIAGITIAGAGFLNFTWKPAALAAALRDLLDHKDTYGRLDPAPKEKILIEFVSANPTGPLHVGHGRGAALGDSLALILAHLGYPVSREYYINDAGNQVELLGQSLLARAQEAGGQNGRDARRRLSRRLFERRRAGICRAGSGSGTDARARYNLRIGAAARRPSGAIS